MPSNAGVTQSRETYLRFHAAARWRDDETSQRIQTVMARVYLGEF